MPRQMTPEEYAEMLADELPQLEQAIGSIENVTYDDTPDGVDDALADLDEGLGKLKAIVKRLRDQKKAEG